MALDVADDGRLADPAEITGTSGAHLAQEPADHRQVTDNGLRRQTAFLAQILTEPLEYLVRRGDWRWRRRRDRSPVTHHRQQSLQRRPVARLDRQVLRPVSQVTLDHALIESGQLPAAARDPIQETPGQIEAPPCAMTGQAVFDETRRVEVEELTVGPTLQAPEQPARAQILFRIHYPVLRC